MLKQLRNKKTAKKIWILLALLIIPAFILWGFGSAFRSRRDSGYAGKIFGRRVSLPEFQGALHAVENQAKIQFGDGFFEMRKYLNLEAEAWSRLILLEEAKRRKIKISDKEVIEFIQNHPFFIYKGRFDNKMYLQMLESFFHAQPRVFEEQMREGLMLAELFKQFTASITLSEAQVREEYRKHNEETSLYYIASIPADFTKDVMPSEEDLKDYFSKNALEFKLPTSFNLDYIASESQDKIRNAASRLHKKANFALAAKDSGLDLKETGLFTQVEPVPGIGWSPEISNLISRLKIGEFSEPIRLDKAYYILRLKEKKDPYVPEYEKAKDRVKEKFIQTESAKLAKTKIEECLKRLKELYQTNPKSADFDKTAKEFNLKSDVTKLFKFGSYIEGIGASDNLWTSAKKLKEDEFSEIIRMPSGFYIIKLKETVAADEKKFSEEKARFSQQLLTQKKQEYFLKFLEELRKKAQ